MKRALILVFLLLAGCASRPRLYVNFNMDCERLKSECHCGGPESWASSEKSIQGFCETLLDAGIPPTLFVVPETAQQHSQLFHTLADRGVELGMHLHPQCWQDHQYNKYLGDYDADAQKQLLADARHMWTDALGRQPRAFRPGNFSASQETLGVLVELGFTHGSVTDPGRNIPDFYADWKNALTYVHWANHRNLGKAGQSRFLEVPLTTDPSKHLSWGAPHELRIEQGPFDKWHRPIIELALTRMEERDVPLRALCIFTHNYWDYSDLEIKHTKTLRAYIDHMKILSENYEVIPATLATIRDHYARMVPPSS
jgi:hypothetical protein